jgi:hypothetical protein
MSTTRTRIDDQTEVTVDSTAFAVTLQAVTVIAASADTVWQILSATDRYPSWNPFVTSFEGTLAAGERITVTLALPRRKPQSMKPTLVSVTPGKGFEWLGHVGVPGILDGRHRFALEPLGADRCRLVHHERLSGMLVPMFRSMLTVNTPEAFVALNQALARQAVRHG